MHRTMQRYFGQSGHRVADAGHLTDLGAGTMVNVWDQFHTVCGVWENMTQYTMTVAKHLNVYCNANTRLVHFECSS